MSQSSSFSFGNLSFNSESQSVSVLQENVRKREHGQQPTNHHERIQQKKEEALRRREQRRAGLTKLASAVQEKVSKVTQKLEASRRLREKQAADAAKKVNASNAQRSLNAKVGASRQVVRPGSERIKRAGHFTHTHHGRSNDVQPPSETQNSLVAGSKSHQAEEKLKEQLARAKKRRKDTPSSSQASQGTRRRGRIQAQARQLVSSQASQSQFKLPQPRDGSSGSSSGASQRRQNLTQSQAVVSTNASQRTQDSRLRGVSQRSVVSSSNCSSQYSQDMCSVSQVQVQPPAPAAVRSSQTLHSQYNVAKPQAVAQSFNAPIGLLTTQSFAGNAGQILGIQHSPAANQTVTAPVAVPDKPKSCNPLRRIPGPIGDIVRTDRGEGESQSASQQPRKESSLLEQRPWKAMLSLLNSLKRVTQTLERVSSESAGYRAQAVRVCIMKMKHLEAGAFAIVTDESGEMEAEIHKDAMDQFPLSLVQGACLLIENAAVFRPYDQYSCASPQLIVLPRNILHIYAPNSSCDVDLGLLNSTSCGHVPKASSAGAHQQDEYSEEQHVEKVESKEEEEQQNQGNSLHAQLVEAIKQSQIERTQKPAVQDEDEAETRREVQKMAMETFDCSDDDEDLENLFDSPKNKGTVEPAVGPPITTDTERAPVQVEQHAKEEQQPRSIAVESKEANSLSEWIDDDDDDDMENLF